MSVYKVFWRSWGGGRSVLLERRKLYNRKFWWKMHVEAAKQNERMTLGILVPRMKVLSVVYNGDLWWLRHCASSRKVVGSRSDEVNAFLSIYLTFPAELGPGVQSASSSNEYHEQKKYCVWEVERSRHVKLSTLRPTVRRLSRQCRILNILQPYGPPRSVTWIGFTSLVLQYFFIFAISHVSSVINI
jgi:hypothetical protein